MHIQAVDKLVSVQVAENTAQDVAGNLNLASDRLQVRHYSVPESSSIIATIVTVTFVATVIVATLLTLATSSLIASGAMSRPSSYSISEPSRNHTISMDVFVVFRGWHATSKSSLCRDGCR